MGKKIAIAVLLILSMVAGFATAKVRVTMDNSLDLIKRDASESLANVDLSGIKVNSDTDIINILLVGSDARKAVDNVGRSDTIIIATLDKKHKRLKMTSLMRDMYVNIPGYGYDKINAAYAYGGVPLLYKTIAQNFNLQLDGYAEVNFKVFKTVVDAVGGINIKLSEKEAQYLNTTNYISNKKYRNVKPGMNKMNGSQALGYSRVRYVGTINGLEDDQGRTYRQRQVLQALFTKIKKMPMSKWMEIANKVLKDGISSDLENDEIISYMKDIVMIGATDVDQMRIPVDGYYHNGTSSGGASVLIIDSQNSKFLQDFIFEYDGTKETTTESK